ncbi:hypothetical protein FLP10_04265 [Agromyces intestinalis]|uniref:DUF559 domain-containing protein n=1 Tax=Agromyces intestinalis TaxID=2592652 RepID=A0A5C1YG13_9MICO|nr:hypothetical protein [Agromyces intestinalis]QEO13722.1 hypothetical protein FLP10_04265 [Agromyces intestinalis]
MLDPHFVLGRLGEVAHISRLRRYGVRDADLRAEVRGGSLIRLKPGWYATPAADAEQRRAVAIGGRLGCTSALARYGVWAGIGDGLHVHLARNASRRAIDGLNPTAFVPAPAVWHPRLPDRQRREIRLSDPTAPATVHWGLEADATGSLDWLVSPRTALAEAVRCLDSEHAQAVVDSAIHERMLRRGEVERIIADAPRRTGVRVDELCGRLESGVETLFVRRLRAGGFDVQPQFQLAGHGRFDGIIDGVVLYEIDGWAHHRTRQQFVADRDRTLIAQAFGMPVIRVAAVRVIDDWPMIAAAVARTVADAKAGRPR